MKTFQRAFVCICLSSIALPLLAMPSQSLSQSMNKLESSDSKVRMVAFYELFHPHLGMGTNAKDGTLKLLRDHPEDRIAISQVLIKLLNRENMLINEAPSGSLPEAYSDYHASLIWSVATLRDGSATIALLGAIKTGGLAADGLVDLGAIAIPAVLKAMASSDRDVRAGATMVLGKIAMKQGTVGLVAANKGVIRLALMRTVEDGDHIVRLASLLSLEAFVDADVRGVMQRAAKVDTSEQVRQAANEWLSRHQSP